MELNKLPKNLYDYFNWNRSNFLNTINNPTAWSSVPMLNYMPCSQRINGALVRFRGMVQDIYKTEMYLESYGVISGTSHYKRDGRYCDSLFLFPHESFNYAATENVLNERLSVLLISLPGQNEWAHVYEKQCSDANIEDGASTSKVTLLDDSSYWVSSPIHEQSSMPCVVKIYDNFDLCGLNQMIDVLGFFSVENNDYHAAFLGKDNKSNELKIANHHIPCIHAAAVHKLWHMNPLMDLRFRWPTYDYTDNILINSDFDMTNLTNLYSTRHELWTLLKMCLFNDGLAADYVLLHLISTVYSRCNIGSMGRFSINLRIIPEFLLPIFGKQFYRILQLLVPASHYFELTSDVLNTVDFIPKKDSQTNQMMSGVLQLGMHTNLVIIDFIKSPVQLATKGVFAIEALINLLKKQQIKVHTATTQVDVNVDIPTLVLSGEKSLFPCDVLLPLNPDFESVQHFPSNVKAAHDYLQQNNRLERFRCFLTQAKLVHFTTNVNEANFVPNDFFMMFNELNITNHVDELNLLFMISRYQGILRGKTRFDRQCWEWGKELHKRLYERVTQIANNEIL